MSAQSRAPTSRAISPNTAKSIVRGIAVPPQYMSFGFSLRASWRTSSMSMRWVSRRTPYCTLLKYVPVIETFQPCVRWPPAGSPMPMIVSPGLQNAK